MTNDDEITQISPQSHLVGRLRVGGHVDEGVAWLLHCRHLAVYVSDLT
jgi:hypothetical protein